MTYKYRTRYLQEVHYRYYPSYYLVLYWYHVRLRSEKLLQNKVPVARIKRGKHHGGFQVLDLSGYSNCALGASRHIDGR